MTDPGTAIAVANELQPAVAEFVTTMTGISPVHEALESVSDRVRGRRARTQIRVLVETEKAIRDAGLEGRVVPDKALTPLLSYASLEDPEDDDMIRRWAALLANAATASPAEVPPSFVEILHQLEPAEARAVDVLVSAEGDRMVPVVDLGVSAAQADNLERLGLLRYEATFAAAAPLPAQLDEAFPRRGYGTSLAIAFVTACQAPGTVGSAAAT
jgi:hypothetical protein